MFKYILIIIIFFTANLSSFSQDFRNTTWGMSKEEVKANETEILSVEEDDHLLYENVSINGMTASLFYSFVDNKLCGALYYFIANYLNENSYIDDYDALEEILISKYGNPTQSDVYWENDRFKDDYGRWGLAIAMGHVEFSSGWNLPETWINLYLHGENLNIELSINYRSNIYYDIYRERKIKDKAKDF